MLGAFDSEEPDSKHDKDLSLAPSHRQMDKMFIFYIFYFLSMMGGSQVQLGGCAGYLPSQ